MCVFFSHHISLFLDILHTTQNINHHHFNRAQQTELLFAGFNKKIEAAKSAQPAAAAAKPAAPVKPAPHPSS